MLNLLFYESSYKEIPCLSCEINEKLITVCKNLAFSRLCVVCAEAKRPHMIANLFLPYKVDY